MNPWPPALLRRIEEISQNASRPARGLMIDGWSIGLSPGRAKRSRAVNAFYPSTRPFEVNHAAACAAFRAAGLPPVFRLSDVHPDREALDARLAAMGMQRFDEALVQVCDLAATVGERARCILRDAVTRSPARELAAQAIGRLRGDTPEQIAAHAARWGMLPLEIRTLEAVDAQGNALATATTIREEDVVGCFEVFTRPEARGRGLAGHLLATLLDTHVQQGARLAYLQVAVGNPAEALYARLGFRTAYRYWYRALPEDAR
jgi:GNAT superfamily N-acetyltransferase